MNRGFRGFLTAPDGERCYLRIVPIPRRYSTDAIVLSRFDYGEADRILTLITPTGGKLKAIAKGIRRPTSRLGGSLEPFAELNVVLARGRTFEVVTQVSVGHAWLNLRDSLESAATAWYLAELADRSLEERHGADQVYALLRRSYELLDAGMAPGRVARWFEMHLADELGVRPEVDRCVECDRSLEVDGRFRWVPPLGGVLCDRCPGPPHDRTALSLDALKLLKAYQRQDVEAISGLRLSAATEREVERVLRDFLRIALERDARSLAFLDEIRTPEATERAARHLRGVAARDAEGARAAPESGSPPGANAGHIAEIPSADPAPIGGRA
jgi:DNA repair protein RecO (recombination protein O)